MDVLLVLRKHEGKHSQSREIKYGSSGQYGVFPRALQVDLLHRFGFKG